MKQKMPNPQLSVFQTFKTKSKELTGEAIRQRGIVMHLALESIPTKKTRTAIAHKLAERNGTTWQNIYSGIFRDLDEILLPLKIVEEAGRLPIKRGPKALQEEGVPYYQLTEGGLLVAASLEEMEKERTKIIEHFFEKNSNSKDKDFKKSILLLLNVAPIFISSILKKYVEAYSIGKIDRLIPFDANSVRNALDDAIIIQRELLEGFASLANSDREPVINFLKSVG
ncbi:MAG TPA: hypothetical protein VFG24_09255 [Nitrosopumilaceae archaeon]|nr:hypothetical protein [Nitrosopumilaceae archaeon]